MHLSHFRPHRLQHFCVRLAAASLAIVVNGSRQLDQRLAFFSACFWLLTFIPPKWRNFADDLIHFFRQFILGLKWAARNKPNDSRRLTKHYASLRSSKKLLQGLKRRQICD